MKRKLIIAFSIYISLFTSCTKDTKEIQEAPEEKKIEEVISVTEISLTSSNITLTAGEKKSINAKIKPSNATDKTIIWKSSNELIASVNNGEITAINAGNATISASSANGTSAKCKLIVKAKVEDIKVTGISLEKSSCSLVEFNAFELSYTISPEKASNKKVIFTSSDEKIASVSNGLIRAISEGSAKISITTVDGGFTAVFTVFVSIDKRLSSFTDERDGRTYKTIKIGEQIWMAENLAYLPQINTDNELSSKKALYYVYGYNGSQIKEAKESDNYKTYGVLYNWEAAKIVAPTGWHIASDAEFKKLESYIGIESEYIDNAGYRGTIAEKLKSTYAWSSKTNGSNTSGFNGLPGGYLNLAGQFSMKGQCGDFWTSSAYEDDKARAGDGWERMLFWTHAGVLRTPAHPEMAYSVRCIKD